MLKAYTIAIWYSVLVLAVLMMTGCKLYSFEEPRACMAPSVQALYAGGYWHGSAVAVGRRTAFTAWHVVDDSEGAVKVTDLACDAGGSLDYGVERKARVTWHSEDRDLAWLTLDSGEPDFRAWAEVRHTPVLQGEVVYVHGVKSHGVAMVADDQVVAYGPMMVQHGDSGGGVFDTRGRLVGIVQAGICGETCSTYTLHPEGPEGENTFSLEDFGDNWIGVEWVLP